MWPDRISNPGPLTYESSELSTALLGPAWQKETNYTVELQSLEHLLDHENISETGVVVVVVVALLFYVHGKHLRSCRDGQLT